MQFKQTVFYTNRPLPRQVSHTNRPLPQQVCHTIRPLPQQVCHTIRPLPQQVCHTTRPLPQQVCHTIRPLPQQVFENQSNTGYSHFSLPQVVSSVQQMESVAHQAEFKELMDSVGAPSYASLEFTIPLSACRTQTSTDTRTGRPYSQFVLPGDGYNLSRGIDRIANRVHVSIPGVALTQEFVDNNPHVTMTVIAPPRSCVATTMRTHVAPVVFGISHNAPDNVYVPHELSSVAEPHVTLSSFLRIR